jgi:histidinol dehydrogenase
MKIIKEPKERDASKSIETERVVRAIIDDVRQRGDAALADYERKFGGTQRSSFRVSEAEIEAAVKSVPHDELAAMKLAAKNIRAFAQAQKASIHNIENFEVMPGLSLGHRVIPVDSALCYVPGGSYPLFSTALMLVIPAKVAGVERVVACSPNINPKTLAALHIAGADEIYAAGGAQAIAAFAYGTAEIEKVDLIVGPGNAYVTEAKRQCYGQVGIDFIAGPSEVLIIADDSADAVVVALDLLAQCEHDVLAQGILVTTSEALAEKVEAEIGKLLETLPTRNIACASWKDYGAIFLAESLEEAASYANSRASEHLELQTEFNGELAAKLRNYGALFIGNYSAEVFGDYAAGTNHTLPTMRAARYTGGLWVGTFLKTLCFQSASRAAAAELAPNVALLAKAEGLAAHAAAAAARG